MKNLQNLFDEYLITEPSAEKIKSATSMMIHLGKALNVPTQEEVTSEYYPEICSALDDYFFKAPHKARLDKAILAEMIGRVGPVHGLKKILEKLLTDKDAEVRQFALQSLDHYGCKKPKTVLPFIERYRKSEDSNMVATAARLTAKVLCSNQHQVILDQMKSWCKVGDEGFIAEIIQRYYHMHKQGSCDEDGRGYKKIRKWVEENCKTATKLLIEIEDE
jgi:hypothetical protein